MSHHEPRKVSANHYLNSYFSLQNCWYKLGKKIAFQRLHYHSDHSKIYLSGISLCLSFSLPLSIHVGSFSIRPYRCVFALHSSACVSLQGLLSTCPYVCLVSPPVRFLLHQPRLRFSMRSTIFRTRLHL